MIYLNEMLNAQLGGQAVHFSKCLANGEENALQSHQKNKSK
jgi:hypothetical protein